MLDSVRIDSIKVTAYKIPTESPESDGTAKWDSTTLVAVFAKGGGHTGFGYSYADSATAELARSFLGPKVEGRNVLDIERVWIDMCKDVRNLGSPGIASMAISAIDVALWDLKAKLISLPLVKLLGQVNDRLPIYGSGGFTSYNNETLRKQFARWAEEGIRMMKMKIGRKPNEDLNRVACARQAIGDELGLFVDANGAYTIKEAINFAEKFVQFGVAWFEEPVSSDNLSGLNLIRDRAPAAMDIAAGEYGYDLRYFNRMLSANAVDVLQADLTRCGGVTGFMKAAALADAWQISLSSHCAPALHLHPALAAARIRHAEYFFDHVRIEKVLLDGLPTMKDGALEPDLSRPGHGLELRDADAARFQIC